MDTAWCRAIVKVSGSSDIAIAELDGHDHAHNCMCTICGSLFVLKHLSGRLRVHGIHGLLSRHIVHHLTEQKSQRPQRDN